MDVYGEWVDAAGKNLLSVIVAAVTYILTSVLPDSVAKEKVENESSGRLGLSDSGRYASGRAGASSRDIDDDDDGGDRRYAGEGVVDDDDY